MKITRKVLLCLVVMTGILILLYSYIWSPSDTLIKQDFESYWKKTSEVFGNLVLLNMKILDKKSGVYTAEVIIGYVWEKRWKDGKKDYMENHDSKVKFNYRKYNTGWKLEKTEDMKFF
jgi:hypothetical protein